MAKLLVERLSLEGPWASIEAGPSVRVVLLNFKGEVRHSWEANIVRSDDTMMVLKAVATRMLRFDEMTIEPGGFRSAILSKERVVLHTEVPNFPPARKAIPEPFAVNTVL